MIKKIFLLFVFFMASIFIKAQNPIAYTTNTLSEAKIQGILDDMRKNGTKDYEIQKTNTFLHTKLKQQNDAMANGTWQQKTILPPPQVMAGCVNPGFEDGTTTGWTFVQGTSSGATLPCPTCFGGTAGGVFEVTTAGATSAANSN